MSIRKARKTHECERYRFRRRNGLETDCSGTIEVGERYAEFRDEGADVYHPTRYHLACREADEREGAQWMESLNHAKGGPS